MVVRKPEAINEEYSSVVVKLGTISLNLSAIERAREAQDKREQELINEKHQLIEKVRELSDEMDEAQKKKKEDEEKLKGKTNAEAAKEATA